MTQGFESLDNIIREECLIQDDYGLHNYLKYLTFAKEALRDLRLNHKNEVSVVIGTTSSIATLAFPDDYLQWSRIGTLEGDRIKHFIVNNHLAFHTDDNDNANYSAYAPTGSVSLYTPDYDAYGTIYGFGNGGYLNDGQFREDKANRRFQFSSEWTDTEVYLEYVGTGLHPSQATVVDGNTSKTIKLYIRWQAIETSRTASLGEKERARQLYYDEYYIATKRSMVNLDKILGIARQAYKTTNK
jgi:hypothetical protein